MNILDLLILLPIAFFVYRGFKNGFIHEVLGIVSVVLAVFLAFHYMDPFSSYIKPYFSDDASYIPFVAALIIFLTTVIVINLIAEIGKSILQTIHLNIINRLAGLVFGALKCSIIISVLLLILAGFNIPSQDLRQESKTYSYVIYIAPWTYDMVASVYPEAEDFAETIQKTIDHYEPIENFPILEL